MAHAEAADSLEVELSVDIDIDIIYCRHYSNVGMVIKMVNSSSNKEDI